MGNSFVYCLVEDVKRHEARCVYQRRVPIKLAILSENSGVFSIGWVTKQLFLLPLSAVDSSMHN